MLPVIPVKSESCSMAMFAVKLVSKKVSETSLLNYNNFWRGLKEEENLESVKHATVF